MKIKLTDILNVMNNCNSIAELKIKSDLLYGVKFDVILDKFFQKMGYKIYKETLVYMSLRDLISFLGMLGDNFEYKNRQLIHKTEEYNTDYYTKHIEEYYLPDCFKFENISINI